MKVTDVTSVTVTMDFQHVLRIQRIKRIMNLCDSYAVFLSNEIFLNEPVTNGQGLLSLRNNFIAISQLSVKITNNSKKKIRI